MFGTKEMSKVRIVGSKKNLKEVIDTLHRLGLMHFDDEAENEEKEIGTGEPYPYAEELSHLLVKTRSAISKLPKLGDGAREDKDVDEIEEEIDVLSTKKKELTQRVGEEKEFLRLVEKVEKVVPESLLTGFDSLKVVAGDIREEGFSKDLEKIDKTEFFCKNGFVVVFTDKNNEKDVLTVLRNYGFEKKDLSRLENVESFEKSRKEAEKNIESFEKEISEIDKSLLEIGENYGGYLKEEKENLETELEKNEAPIKFSTTDTSFIGEGWTPTAKVDELEEALSDINGGSILFEAEKEEKEGGNSAPVDYKHNALTERFEPLLEMYSPPKYVEIDPTFILALTFPVFYGLMLSDFGYGLLTFGVFAALRVKMSDFRNMLDMMLLASVSTMFFGLLGGSAFGVPIFGPESVIGTEFLTSLPILLDFQNDVMTLILISLAMGFVQLNTGIIIGFYNNLVSKGLGTAVLKNFSWILFEAGLILLGTNFTGLTSVHNGFSAALILTGCGMYLKGEGALGVMNLVLAVTDVLSYIRLMALGIATVSIASVINMMAGIFFNLGIIGVLLGTIVLIGGHVFNIAFQVLGSSLHSLRLNFVEFFDKFYEGGGEKFKPFGRKTV